MGCKLKGTGLGSILTQPSIEQIPHVQGSSCLHTGTVQHTNSCHDTIVTKPAEEAVWLTLLLAAVPMVGVCC